MAEKLITLTEFRTLLRATLEGHQADRSKDLIRACDPPAIQTKQPAIPLRSLCLPACDLAAIRCYHPVFNPPHTP
jgi:hypothetical protein